MKKRKKRTKNSKAWGRIGSKKRMGIEAVHEQHHLPQEEKKNNPLAWVFPKSTNTNTDLVSTAF
jgi:hypothetical protein